jgi:pimeloyl-ACP methyl ester carboxylesterase
MPVLTVDRAPLFYATHPAREPEPLPVILLHGAGASHLTWPADLRRLPGASVYAPDLPGHGRSGGHGRNTIEAYSAVVQGWQEAAGIGPALWIGHSLGGAIALDLALNRPEVCRGLVLIGTVPHLTIPPEVRRDLSANPNRAIEALIALADTPFALIEATRRMMREVPPTVIRSDFEAAAAFDVRDRLAEIRIPTLVISAQDDRLTPWTEARRLAQAIPGARLVTLSAGGHLAVASRSTAIRDAILDLVKTLTSHA